MKKIRLFLLAVTCTALAMTCFSQTMSNTDNVITLTNTCINAGVAAGPSTYTLELNYYDLDFNTNPTVTIPNVTVTVSGGVMTITAPAGTFPSVATNSWWSLPDAYPGRIKLTSGNTSTFMYWYQNPDGSIGFNCVALPIDYNSFTAHLSGSQAILNWQTGQEQNSTVFEVYRSSGGSGGYYKIGQVAASGNSSIPVNYTFTDVHPCSSNVYYVKMLNSQGTPPISSSFASVGCSTCTCTLPSPVNCNFTINGPDYICNLETLGHYSLSAPVPNFSTIAWSVDVPSAVHLYTYPGFDDTKVSLLKKNTAAGVTLTATLSGCSNTITKFVTLGTPTPYVNYYVTCPDLFAYAANAPGAMNFIWTLTDETTGAQTVNPLAGPSWAVDIATGHTYDIGFTYTNVCGTSYPGTSYGFICDPSTGGGGPGIPQDPIGLAISPNPSRGLVTIGIAATGVVPAMKSNSAAALATAMKPRVYQVRVVDALGIVRKTFAYPGGTDTIPVDLSGLNNGVYIIQVFDNKTWRSKKVILSK